MLLGTTVGSWCTRLRLCVNKQRKSMERSSPCDTRDVLSVGILDSRDDEGPGWVEGEV